MLGIMILSGILITVFTTLLVYRLGYDAGRDSVIIIKEGDE